MFSGAVIDLAMSPNGELCCTVSDDKTAKVFDVINFGGSALFSGFFYTSLSLVGNLGCFALVRRQQPQEQCHPFQPVCAVFSCVQTMAWLPVFGN